MSHLSHMKLNDFFSTSALLYERKKQHMSVCSTFHKKVAFSSVNTAEHQS